MLNGRCSLFDDRCSMSMIVFYFSGESPIGIWIINNIAGLAVQPRITSQCGNMDVVFWSKYLRRCSSFIYSLRASASWRLRGENFMKGFHITLSDPSLRSPLPHSLVGASRMTNKKEDTITQSTTHIPLLSSPSGIS